MNFQTGPLLVLIACTFMSVHSTAQIVNIENARMHSDTTGWMGSTGAAVSLTKNTTQVFSADADAHLQYKTKKNLYLLLGSYGFLKGAGTKLIDNMFLHFRYNYKLTKVLRWEAFTQIQNNRVTGISSRFLLGTGPRFKLVDNKLARIYLASLIMYEREDETTDDIIQNNVRNSSYVSFTITPNKHVELVSTTFFQPKPDDWNDFRILNEVSLRVKAAKRIDVRINWNYLNDSKPVEGVPSVNYSLSTGFDYSFK